MAIGKVTASDGTVYVHTHTANSGEEIAEALRPYIGHFIAFYPPNNYGHVNPQQATWAWLRAIDGTRVSVYVPRTGYRGTVDAYDGFRHYATRIDPQREGE